MRTALPLLMLLSTSAPLLAQDAPLFTLEQYLLDFDYAERRDRSEERRVGKEC